MSMKIIEMLEFGYKLVEVEGKQYCMNKTGDLISPDEYKIWLTERVKSDWTDIEEGELDLMMKSVEVTQMSMNDRPYLLAIDYQNLCTEEKPAFLVRELVQFGGAAKIQFKPVKLSSLLYMAKMFCEDTLEELTIAIESHYDITEQIGNVFDTDDGTMTIKESIVKNRLYKIYYKDNCLVSVKTDIQISGKLPTSKATTKQSILSKYIKKS